MNAQDKGERLQVQLDDNENLLEKLDSDLNNQNIGMQELEVDYS